MNGTPSLIRETIIAATVSFTIIIVCTEPAGAGNGFFSYGYGAVRKGMAGAGVALPQDALDIATNPAGIAFQSSGYDIGLSF
jgi:long-chain fatty acid transport protein